MGDDATVEILLKWKQENEAIVALVQARLAELGVQSQATAVGTQAVNAAALAGVPAFALWAGGIAAATAILWPFVILVGSAAVILTSFAVGAAGFLSLAALVAGAFAAIGGGVLLLGGGSGAGAADALTKATTQLSVAQQAVLDLQQRIAAQRGPETLSQRQQMEDLLLKQAQAQQKYNDALAASQGPGAVLISQLSQMRDTLAQQATPLAAMITQWAAGAIPGATQLGQTIMTWFGDRLPSVLGGISKIIKDLSPDFTAFGSYFAGVMDKVGPTLAPIAEGFARLALQGAKGLIDNLVRLSDWFLKELPSIGPIVQQIFGKIGDAVQWVASNWATLNDFAVNKWPTTVANVQRDLKALQEWWDKNGGTVKTFGGNIVDLMGQLNNIIGVWSSFYGFLNGVGLTPTPLLDAFNKIGGAVRTLTSDAEKLWGILSKVTGGGGGPSGGGGVVVSTAMRQRGFGGRGTIYMT